MHTYYRNGFARERSIDFNGHNCVPDCHEAARADEGGKLVVGPLWAPPRRQAFNFQKVIPNGSVYSSEKGT